MHLHMQRQIGITHIYKERGREGGGYTNRGRDVHPGKEMHTEKDMYT